MEAVGAATGENEVEQEAVDRGVSGMTPGGGGVGGISEDCQLRDAAVPMNLDPMPHIPQIQQRLQTLVDAVTWVYATFWKLDEAQRSLVFADGCYRGAPLPGAATESTFLEQQSRREFLRQLQSAAFQGGDQDLASRFASFDLLPLEWFYLLSANFNFPIGIGTPGRAFSRGCSEWLSEADKVNSLQFTRADMAKAAGIKTLVCVPVSNGVVELGTTELLREDPSLTTFVRELFDGRRMDMISQAAAALLMAATNNSNNNNNNNNSGGPSSAAPMDSNMSGLSGPSSAPMLSPTTPPSCLRTGLASPSMRPLGSPGGGFGNNPTARGTGGGLGMGGMGGTPSPAPATGGQMVRELLAADARVTDLLEQRQLLTQLLTSNQLRLSNHPAKADGRQNDLEMRLRLLLSPLASASGNGTRGSGTPHLPVDQEVRQRVAELHQLQQEVENDLKEMSREVSLSPASLLEVMQQNLNQLQPGVVNNILTQPAAAASMRNSSSPSLGMDGQWPKNLLGHNAANTMNMFQTTQQQTGNGARRPSSGRPVAASDWNTWRQPPPPLMQLPVSVQQVRSRNEDNLMGQQMDEDILMRLDRMDPPPISPGALSMSIGGQSASMQQHQQSMVRRNEASFITQPLLSPDAGTSLSLGPPPFNGLLSGNVRENAEVTQDALVDKIEQLLQDQPNGSSRLPALEDLMAPGQGDYHMSREASAGGGGGNGSGQESLWSLPSLDFGLQDKDDMSPIWAARATQSAVPNMMRNRVGGLLVSSDVNNSQGFLGAPGSPSFGGGQGVVLQQQQQQQLNKRPPRRAGNSSGPPSPAAGLLPSLSTGRDNPGGTTSAVPALSSRSSPSVAPSSPLSEDMSECVAAKQETGSTSKRGWKEFYEPGEGEREVEGGGAGENKKACTPPPTMGGGRRQACSSGGGSSEGDVPQPPKDNVSHLMAERKRREKLNEKYSILRTLVPQVGPKADKLAVLGDTIKYVQELKTKATILRESYLEEKLAKLDEVTGQLSTPDTPGSQDASALDSGEGAVDLTEPHIEVKKGVDEGQVLLIVRCKDRVGLFLDMMLTVHKLRLQVIHARVNTDSHSVKFGLVTKFNDTEHQTPMDDIADALRFTCDRPGWQPSTPPARAHAPPLPPTTAMPPPTRGLAKRAPSPRSMKNT